MDNAAARGHPLHTTLLQIPFVTQMVTVLHVAFHQVGHRFKAPVRVRREAGNVIIRIIRGERVQHQKGIQPHHGVVAQRPLQANTGTVGCIQRANGVENCAFHGNLLM